MQEFLKVETFCLKTSPKYLICHMSGSRLAALNIKLLHVLLTGKQLIKSTNWVLGF